VDFTVPAPISALLERSRELGFLGPQPAAHQAEHALGFWRAVESRLDSPARILDLGSGGGLPGLVLLPLFPQAQFTLLDGSVKRCEFLAEAIEELDEAGRVEVRCGRAEDLGHETSLRGSFELVVARSFGAPAVLAECTAPFLAPGGHLLVSEPPEGTIEERWPIAGLALLGMGPAELIEQGSRFALIPQVASCADRYPRRTGVPAKRPLF